MRESLSDVGGASQRIARALAQNAKRCPIWIAPVTPTSRRSTETPSMAKRQRGGGRVAGSQRDDANVRRWGANSLRIRGRFVDFAAAHTGPKTGVLRCLNVAPRWSSYPLESRRPERGDGACAGCVCRRQCSCESCSVVTPWQKPRKIITRRAGEKRTACRAIARVEVEDLAAGATAVVHHRLAVAVMRRLRPPPGHWPFGQCRPSAVQYAQEQPRAGCVVQQVVDGEQHHRRARIRRARAPSESRHPGGNMSRVS